MKNSPVLVMVCMLVSALTAFVAGQAVGGGWDCGRKRRMENKIVGGDETMVNEYPWMLQLQLQGNSSSITEVCEGEFEYRCGGALISSKWALTAAHCLVNGNKDILPTSRFRIVIGAHKLKEADEYSTNLKIPRINVDVSKKIIHPQYLLHNNNNYSYDIAMVKLAETVDLNVYTPVCLPTTGDNFDGKRAWTYGWGWDFVQKYADVLMEVSVPIVRDSVCAQDRKQACAEHSRFCQKCLCEVQRYCEYYCDKCMRREQPTCETSVWDVQLCAGGEKRGKSICKGDSGSPLTVDVNGKHTLVGIVQRGYGGCKRAVLENVIGDAKYYGIFTEVAIASVRPWITESMDANDGKWGPWGGWGTCQLIGNDCKQMRTRTCINPEPLREGKKCTGDATESKDCLDYKCEQPDPSCLFLGWDCWTFYDLMKIVNIRTWRDCQARCERFQGCNIWSWRKPTHRYKPNTCWLKSGNCLKKIQDFNMISGPRDCK